MGHGHVSRESRRGSDRIIDCDCVSDLRRRGADRRRTADCRCNNRHVRCRRSHRVRRRRRRARTRNVNSLNRECIANAVRQTADQCSGGVSAGRWRNADYDATRIRRHHITGDRRALRRRRNCKGYRSLRVSSNRGGACRSSRNSDARRRNWSAGSRSWAGAGRIRRRDSKGIRRAIYQAADQH